MSTIELFATTIVAAFWLGFIVGALAMRLDWAASHRRERDRIRDAQRQLRNITERADRLNWRAQHLGTPYRDETLQAARSTPGPFETEIREILGLAPDTHNASRKAAALEVVR